MYGLLNRETDGLGVRQMRLAFGCIVVVVFCFGVLPGARASGGPREGAPSPTEVTQALRRVSGLPVEYQADLGLTILSAQPKSITLLQKRRFLLGLFRTSASARYPFLRIDAAHHRQSLAGQEQNALRFSKVSALDIRTRIVEYALAEMPAFAVRLYGDIRLEPTSAHCEDASVVNVSSYYAVTRYLIEDQRITSIQGMTKARYLSTLASQTGTVMQLGPMAELLAGTNVPATELEGASAALATAMGRMDASDREMVAAELGGALTKAVASLSNRLAMAKLSSESLWSAYRSFLVNTLAAQSCADYTTDREEVVRRFNALVPHSYVEGGAVELLDYKQLAPKSRGGVASDGEIPVDVGLFPQFQRIAVAHDARMAQEYRLRQPGTIEPEDSDIEAVLRYTTSNKQDSSCSLCEFYAKSTMFFLLMDLLPAGHDLERAINGEVDYLSFNTIELDDPPAWILFLQQILNVSRRPSHKALTGMEQQAKKGFVLAATPSPEAKVIRGSLSRSADPIVSTYIGVDQLLHLPYQPLGVVSK
jgi:hypothetical protein